ncbi:hypothetical protein ASZ90_017672 [hydrocarbon metagenome]|uniref:Uncharacterized protein n=1 Tax=hydrocarbon metagenome TaxID=938273 RepID=A0A0W8E962_9ZZZZ
MITLIKKNTIIKSQDSQGIIKKVNKRQNHKAAKKHLFF